MQNTTGVQTGFSNQTGSTIEMEGVQGSPISGYHQDAVFHMINSGEFHWTLPVDPGTVTDESLRFSHAALSYEKACKIIGREWRGVTAFTCVPADRRAMTPYSLIMLIQLRRLASHTKKNRAAALDALDNAWQMRQAANPRLSVEKPKVVCTQVHEDDEYRHFPFAEMQILEVEQGLILEDVGKALKAIAAERKKLRRQEKTPRARGGNKRQAMAADGKVFANASTYKVNDTPDAKISKRRLRKAERKARVQIHGPKGDKLLRFLQDEENAFDRASESEHLHPASANGSGATAGTNVPQQQMPMTDPSLCKTKRADRHNDKMMSRLFVRMDLVNEKTQDRLHKRMEMGGDSRSNACKSMPAEKMEWAKMPSLFEQMRNREAGEMELGFDKLNLEEEDNEEGGVQL